MPNSKTHQQIILKKKPASSGKERSWEQCKNKFIKKKLQTNNIHTHAHAHFKIFSTHNIFLLNFAETQFFLTLTLTITYPTDSKATTLTLNIIKNSFFLKSITSN